MIPALVKQRQEDCFKFKASMSYIEKPYTYLHSHTHIYTYTITEKDIFFYLPFKNT